MSDNTIRIPENYFTPRDYQRDIFAALDRGIRRIMMVWARQLGKDTTTFCAMAMQALKTPGNYFYIFPTRESAKRAVWEKIDHAGKELMSVIPKEMILRKSDQEMMLRIQAIGGTSTIRFIGLDYNPDSIRGVTPMGVAFSEFAYQDPMAYKTIMPAIRQNKKCWVIYNSTPQGKNHFYKMYKANKHNPSWFVSEKQVLYTDRDTYVNNIISPTELKAIQREEGLTDEEIAQEFGVDWAIGAQGSIYADCLIKAETEGRIGDYMPNHQKWVDTFWDIGFNDPTAIWFRQISGNKEIMVDYYEAPAKDISAIVEMLSAKGYKYRTHYLPHDADNNNPGMPYTYSELLSSFLKQSPMQHTGDVEVCDKFPIQDGIHGVRSRFPNLCFDAGRCQQGLERLEGYHRRYDAKRGVYVKEPVHDENSHAADALRTLISAEEFEHRYHNNNKIKVFNDYDLLK